MLTRTCTSLSPPGCTLTMRNMSPRPSSYGATTADSLNRSRIRGRVSRAMSKPAVATRTNGPKNDSNTTSQCAEAPGQKDGERRRQRAKIEALDALSAESVLPARRLAVVRQEPSAHLVGDH